MVFKTCSIAAACLLLLHGLAFAQIPGSGLSANSGYDVGPNYHSATADFSNGPFISRYHDPGVRATVRGQLQTMADSGASVVKTTLWQVGGKVQSWRLSFPLTERELSNIQTYASDVANTKRRDGGYLNLQLTLAWLGCADYTLGSSDTTVGYCAYPWNTFIAHARNSIAALVRRVEGVVRPDGKQAVSKLYLELEVMIGAKPNQDKFLVDLYPYFLTETTRAGLDGSLYFNVSMSEAQILDDGYIDIRYPVLNGRKSMFWLYRSVDFLRANGLTLPDRLDFSFYPERLTVPYSQLVDRVMDDFQAVFPAYRAAVVETYYFDDASRRAELGQALGAAYLARGLPEQVSFWTTPYGGLTADAAPPFDLAAFALTVPAGTASHISTSGPCLIQPNTDRCSTTLMWNTTAQSATAAVWLDTGSGGPTLIACGKNGQVITPLIRTGTAYTFSLHATPACGGSTTDMTGVRVASVLVTATASPSDQGSTTSPSDQGSISATPNPCSVRSNPTCTAVISWHAAVSSGTAQVFVRQGAGAPQLFACGIAGQQQAPWIQPAAQYTFTLHVAPACNSTFPQNAPLASVTVTAQQ